MKPSKGERKGVPAVVTRQRRRARRTYQQAHHRSQRKWQTASPESSPAQMWHVALKCEEKRMRTLHVTQRKPARSRMREHKDWGKKKQRLSGQTSAMQVIMDRIASLFSSPIIIIRHSPQTRRPVTVAN